MTLLNLENIDLAALVRSTRGMDPRDAIETLENAFAQPNGRTLMVCEALLDALSDNGQLQRAWKVWSAGRDLFNNEILYVRRGLRIFLSQVEATSYSFKELCSKFPIETALEVSLIKKIANDRFGTLKQYVTSITPLTPSLSDRARAVLALSIGEPEPLRANSYADFLDIVNNLAFWQVSKLVRVPTFPKNEIFVRDFIGFLLNENELSKVTAKGAVNLLLLSYVVSLPFIFDELVRRLRGLYGSSIQPVSAPEGFLCAVTSKFKLPEERSKIDLGEPVPKGFLSVVASKLKPLESRSKIALSVSDSSGQKLNVAICISGQSRGFVTAAATLKNLGLDGENVDYFVHTWKDVGRRMPDPEIVGSTARTFEGPKFVAAFNKVGMSIGTEALEVRYPSLYNLLRSTSTTTKDALRACYGQNAEIVIEDETDPSFADFNNQMKMHYKIYACDQLVRHSGKHYDLVIKLRPDKIINDNSTIDWRSAAAYLNGADVIWTEEPARLRENLVIGDQFGVGSSRNMEIYASAWLDLPRAMQERRFSVPHGFIGHTSLAFTVFAAGIRVGKPEGLNFGAIVDVDKITNEVVRSALQQDLPKGPVTDADRHLLEACS